MNKNQLGHRYAIGLWMLFCLTAGSAWGQSAQDLPAEVIAYAEIIFYNGKVLTADEAFTIEEAVAIRDGKFLAVGSSQRILAMAGPNTRRVDVEGRSVIPGLIASHEHSAFVGNVAKRGQGGRVEFKDVASGSIAVRAGLEEALQKELRDLSKKRENILDVLMSMPDSPGVQDRLRSIENDIASKAAQSDDLRVQLRLGMEPALDFLGGVKAGIISLHEVWKMGSDKERQGVARSIINWIRISSDRASFHGEFSPVPTGQSFRSGGGTRTPDTRIMIPLL